MIDYLSENLWLLWTLVCVLALILEVSSGTFYLLCFAVGAYCLLILRHCLMGTGAGLCHLLMSLCVLRTSGCREISAY